MTEEQLAMQTKQSIVVAAIRVAEHMRNQDRRSSLRSIGVKAVNHVSQFINTGFTQDELEQLTKYVEAHLNQEFRP